MASLYGRPPRPQKKKAKAKSKLQFIRNERKASMAGSGRRQLGLGPNEGPVMTNKMGLYEI